MFSSTTDAVAELQSLPFTMATVCPLTVPHAADTGVVGVGEGEVEFEVVVARPPHAPATDKRPQRVTPP
jgi:hypothetical protein